MISIKIKRLYTFKAWGKVVSYEKKRGGKRREKQIRRLKSQKDERTIPMSKAHYEGSRNFNNSLNN